LCGVALLILGLCDVILLMGTAALDVGDSSLVVITHADTFP